jgi:hypothetical protein
MGRVFRLAQPVVLCIALLALATATLCAQDALPIPERSTPHLGIPQDWSTQHVIYTHNGSPEDMLKVRNDPRFLNNILLHYAREHRNQLPLNQDSLNLESLSLDGLNRDSLNLDRFSEDGSNENGLSQDDFTEEDSIDDAEDLFSPFASERRRHHHHHRRHKNKRSKVDWSISLGPTGGLAMGESPGVYTYNYSTPSCSTLSATPPVVGDFIVYTINAPAAVGSQANLVGLTNLYTTGAGNGYCAGTGPSFLFSYAIGSGGSPLSPVLSLDGTKIAWIEARTSTTPAAYLHITTWVANQGGSATAPVAVTGTFSNGVCTPTGSSCDDAIDYTASTYPGCSTAYVATNGHSDLYVDYFSNTGFISANNGLLYHIKNIFSTTAAPSVDFCIPVNAIFEGAPSAAMSGPVYDSLLNQVFITDSETIYSYTVNAYAATPNFALAAYKQYASTASNYTYETGPGPLLDILNNYIYVFSTYDLAGKTSVTQLPTSLASAVPVELGGKSTNTNPYLFYGAFDNNYYNNGPANSASTLYSCGADTTTTEQDLYAISFNATSGLANTTPAMSANTHVNPGGTNGVCSPITEFYDGTTDRIFVGMGEAGATTGSNVVTMWNVTSRLTSASTYTAEATNYTGGTSGIVADNAASGTAQAESIYFSTENIGSASTLVTGTGYNITGIYNNGSTYSCSAGLDTSGYSYSSNLLGTSVTWNGTTFTFGTAGAADVWTQTTITLPTGTYNTLNLLGGAIYGPVTGTFTVTYTDNSTTTFTQSLSDWLYPQGYSNESIAATMAYNDYCNGGNRTDPTYLYGYSFALNPAKTLKSLTLPAARNVVVLAAAVSGNCGGKDYCAVKLTQSALQ